MSTVPFRHQAALAAVRAVLDGVAGDDAETEIVDFREEAGTNVRGTRRPIDPKHEPAAQALANEVACFANNARRRARRRMHARSSAAGSPTAARPWRSASLALAYLDQHADISRQQAVRLLDLEPKTATRVLGQLLDRGVLEYSGPSRGRNVRYRPPRT